MSESKTSVGNITEDTLLAGRIALAQPAKGYRVAIDPVLLAASVPAVDDETVLDAGAGVGAAALCLAERLPGVKVEGLEIVRSQVRLAVRNAGQNGLSDRVDFREGDILNSQGCFKEGSFDHVMANPPYFKASRGNPPPDPTKAMSTIEGAAGLGHWIDFCVGMVRNKGSVTMIHQAERLDEILSLMYGRLGKIVVFPLWPGPGDKPAKRIIVRGRKGVSAPARISPGLVLHLEDGAYTPEAQKVLRDGLALALP